MNEFWELLKESTITQALVTLIVIGTDCYLFVTRQPIPELLGSLTLLVIGFWFGAKSTASASSIVKSVAASQAPCPPAGGAHDG